MTRSLLVLAFVLAFVGVRCTDTEAHSVTPGATAAEINALITTVSTDGGGTITFSPGAYTLEASLVLKDNVTLHAPLHNTILICGASMANGPVDDDANALIKIHGVLDTTTLDSTLNVSAKEGTLTWSVAASPPDGALVGRWIYVEGNNLGDDVPYGSGGNLYLLQEMARVVGNTGGTLALAIPSAQYHKMGLPARGVLPVLAARVTGNFTLDCTTNPVAAGISLRYAAGWYIDGTRFKGFTRSGINVAKGSTQGQIRRIHSLGRNNALLFLDSATRVDVADVTTDPQATDRQHPSLGTTRGTVTLRNRSSDITMRDLSLRRVPIGILHWGGHRIEFVNVLVDDIDATVAYARLEAAGEDQAGTDRGWCYCGNSNMPALSELSQYVRISGLRCSKLNTLSTSDYAIYVHDTRALRGDIQVDHFSQAALSGVLIKDSNGHLDYVRVQGTSFGLVTSGTYAQVDITQFDFDGAHATGTGGVAIQFNNRGAQSSLKIGRARLAPAQGGYVRFGNDFVNNPDFYLEIDYLITEEGRWSGVRPVLNASGGTLSVGDLVEIDPMSSVNAPRVRTSTAPNVRPAVVAVGASQDVGSNGAILLVSPLPADIATIRCTAAAVPVGDHVVQSSTAGRCVSASSPAAHTSAGKVVIGKDAGAEGVVTVSR